MIFKKKTTLARNLADLAGPPSLCVALCARATIHLSDGGCGADHVADGLGDPPLAECQGLKDDACRDGRTQGAAAPKHAHELVARHCNRIAYPL